MNNIYNLFCLKVQYNFDRTLEEGLRRQAAEIRAGAVGNVSEVHVWTNRPIWPQGPNRDLTLAKFAEKVKKSDPDLANDEIAEKKKQIESALKNMDWDLWLGVAPKREFWPGLYHSFAWRGWWDFGTGALGDMGCHIINMPFKACDIRDPVSVIARSSGHDFNSFPASSVTIFEVPANDWRGPLQYTWYDSKQTPPNELADKYGFGSFSTEGGCLVIGDKGAFYSGKYQATGGTKLDIPKDVEFAIAPIDDQNRGGDARHKFEWFKAIWENKPELCWSNFANHAGPLTETVLLGNLAIWAAAEPDKMGEKIEWDAANLKIKNLADLKTPGIENLVVPIYPQGYDQIEL